MKTTPGALRQGGVAIVVAGLLLALSGIWSTASVAFAKPTKQPDTTTNDHPSGKDRTEPAPAGASTSDPDGNTNGGADKPGGDGGFDADKDWNNGCGNDDDFEDDNNGNCGGRRVGGGDGGSDDAAVGSQGGSHTRTHSGSGSATGVQPQPSQTATVGSHSHDATHATGAVTAAAGTASGAGGGGDVAVRGAGDTQVLGTSFVRDGEVTRAVGSYVAADALGNRPAALAATGLAATAMAALAVVLIALGLTLIATARRAQSSLA